MPRRSRAVALAPVLLSFLAPSAAGADPDPDCEALRQAAGNYSQLDSHLSSLRKVAQRPDGGPDQHKDIRSQIAEQSRSMGAVLRDLAGKLADQDLKNLYWEDAESFDDYADAVESNPTNSPEVRSAYNRNIQAVTAANKAYHSRCKR